MLALVDGRVQRYIVAKTVITTKANPGVETTCWRIFAIPTTRLEIINKRWKRIDTVISIAIAREDEDCRDQGRQNQDGGAPELGGIGREPEAALRDGNVRVRHDEVTARIGKSVRSGIE